MTFHEFEKAVTKLFRDLRDDEPVPTKQLKAIYDEVRNSTAFELAEKQRQLDLALERLHAKYLKGEKPNEHRRPKG